MSWRGRRRWLRVSKVYESTSSRPHLLWETAAGVWTETDPAAGSVCFNVIFSAASESHSVHCMQRARRVHHLLPFFVLFSVFVCENWAETDVKTVSWCVQWHLVCKCKSPHSSQTIKLTMIKKHWNTGKSHLGMRQVEDYWHESYIKIIKQIDAAGDVFVKPSTNKYHPLIKTADY